MKKLLFTLLFTVGCVQLTPTSPSKVIGTPKVVEVTTVNSETIEVIPTPIPDPKCQPDHRQECEGQEWNYKSCRWEGRCPAPTTTPEPESTPEISSPTSPEISSPTSCGLKDPFCLSFPRCKPKGKNPCPEKANWDYCSCAWVNFNGALNQGCTGPINCTKTAYPPDATSICTWVPEGRDSCNRPIGCFWSCL